MGTKSKTVYYCKVVDNMMQEKLKNQLDQMNIARFTIVVGDSAMGCEEIAKCIATRCNATFVDCGIKVDDVRNIISMAYKQSSPIAYVFKNSDLMSPAAKNALLKVIEEPPRQAYFIMILKDKANTLATILSRGMVITLNPYTAKELRQYVLRKNKTLNKTQLNYIENTCTTPEQVNLLLSYGIEEFYEFVENVVDYLPEVTITNSLKIAARLNLKDKEEEQDKYDVGLFLNTYTNLVLDKFLDGIYDEEQIELIMNSLLTIKSRLRVVGINKSSLVKQWLMRQWEIVGGEDIA